MAMVPCCPSCRCDDIDESEEDWSKLECPQCGRTFSLDEAGTTQVETVYEAKALVSAWNDKCKGWVK